MDGVQRSAGVAPHRIVLASCHSGADVAYAGDEVVGGSQVAASPSPFCMFSGPSTASRLSGSLANGVSRFSRLFSLQLKAEPDAVTMTVVGDAAVRPISRRHAAIDLPFGEVLPLGDPPFNPEMAEHFWQSFATQAGVTLHVTLRAGRNTHHILEAVFKAVARCLRDVSDDRR